MINYVPYIVHIDITFLKFSTHGTTMTLFLMYTQQCSYESLEILTNRNVTSHKIDITRY